MSKIFVADILSHTDEGKSVGHYFALARNYQELFGGRVVVAGGPVYRMGFDTSELLVLPYNTSGTGLKTRIKTFFNACKLFKEAQGHIIILQQCTTITMFLCIALFYHGKSRLYLIQYSSEGFRMKLGQIFFRFAKKKIDGIICPNDTVGNYFQGVPYCVVPDYIYTVNTENKTFSYKDKYYDICIVGRIAPEKGVVEVARYFSNTKYKVLIAGRPQTEELTKELREACEHSSNIKLHLDYISEQEYTDYLNNSKYAILNYSAEYSSRSSGVVFDMLFNNIPVIGRRCESLQFIEKYELGMVYDEICDINIEKIFDIDFYEKTQIRIKEYCKGMYKHAERLQRFIEKTVF